MDSIHLPPYSYSSGPIRYKWEILGHRPYLPSLWKLGSGACSGLLHGQQSGLIRPAFHRQPLRTSRQKVDMQ